MTTSPEGARHASFNTDDCFRLLHTQLVGRLVLPGDPPRVRPVNYVLDGRDILIRTDEPIGEHHGVAFEVDQVDNLEREGWSVVATGHISTASPVDIESDTLDELTPWAPGTKPWVSRLVIEEINGRWVRAGRDRYDLDDRGYI